MKVFSSVLVFTAVAVTLTSMADAATSAVILEAEKSVAALAVQAESIHAGRCQLLGSCSCTTPGCSQEFKTSNGFECNKKFGSSHAVDSSETEGAMLECKSQIRGLDTTIVRLPAATSSTKATEEFVCSSKDMEPRFISNYKAGNLTAWQYVGHADGGIRLYPGSPQDNSGSCSPYDARLRPWYLSAASGPKDVVIVIDKSGSMDEKERMELVQCATSSLLSTLTFADYFDVVSFSDSGHPHGGGLLQATEENINNMKAAVNNISPDGGTKFNHGFTVAFDELQASTRGSNCQKVILFLTDGEQGDSGTIGHIQSLRARSSDKVHIFTFAMGSGASTGILKSIACDNYGAFSSITDGTNPLDKMSAYYKFLAAGIDDSTIRWTEPYIDAFGMGKMVTASRAVYDRSTPVPLLVGVVGTDITTDNFVETGEALLSALLERSTICPTFNITTCQMQLIREAETGYSCPAQQSPSSCSEAITPTSCSSNKLSGTSSRFCSPSSGSLSTSDYTCCNAATCGASTVFPSRSLWIAVLVSMVSLMLAQ